MYKTQTLVNRYRTDKIQDQKTSISELEYKIKTKALALPYRQRVQVMSRLYQDRKINTLVHQGDQTVLKKQYQETLNLASSQLKQ